MSDVRQLPLFPTEPASPEDITRYTRMTDTFDLFADFLRSTGKTDNTIKAFMSDLKLLAEYIAQEIAIGEIETGDLNRFLHWLEHGRGVPCSRKSYARRVTTLKVFFKWLTEIHALPYDPAKAVLQRSGPAPLSDVLTPQQIHNAIGFAQMMKTRRGDDQDTRPEMLFRLLLDTGIKKSEAMLLTPASIDRSKPQHPVLYVRYKVRNVFKERNIPLDSEWVKLLDMYLDQYAPKETIFNCTARNLEYILSDVGTGAGIPFRLSFEVMRWTCAVRDYRRGDEEDAIRLKLGLSEISWHETGSKIKRLVERQIVEESG